MKRFDPGLDGGWASPAPEEADDNWLGTILLLGGALVAVIGASVWELLGGPDLLLKHIGAPATMALIAALLCAFAAGLLKGENTDLAQAAIGLAIAAAGLALEDNFHGGLGRLGLFVAAAGGLLVVRRLWLWLRRLFELPEEEFGRARWIGLSLPLMYLFAVGPGVGALHAAVAAALLWPLMPGTHAFAARQALRFHSMRSMFSPREVEPEVVHYEDPLAVFGRNGPIVAGIQNFVRENFAKAGWEAEISPRVYDSPFFTTFVLRVPTRVPIASVLTRSLDLASAIGKPGEMVALLPASHEGGVYIQIRKPDRERSKLWFDDALNRDRTVLKKKMSVVLGVDVRGDPVVLDIDDRKEPHLLAAGGTGSGKSGIIHVMLVQLLAKNSPADLLIAIIDPKLTLGDHYKQVPHLFAPVVLGTDGAIDLMRTVRDQIEPRMKIITAADCSSLAGYREQGGQMPYLLLVIDEATDLSDTDDDKTLKEAYAQYVKEIANKGRAAGVLLMIGVQRPSMENVGKFRNNLTKRVVLHLPAKTESEMALGDDTATKLGGSGDGILVSHGSHTRYSGAYLPDENDRDKPGLTARALVRQIIDKWSAAGFPPRDWAAEPPPTMAPVAAPDAAAARILAEHGPDCSDREWLVVCGVQLAFAGQTDPYGEIVFSPESLSPFVRRAAEERGHTGEVIGPDEIQRILAAMFPENGRPQRARTWPFNSIVAEALVERFAAPPAASIPETDVAKATAAQRAQRVADVRGRRRRDA